MPPDKFKEWAKDNRVLRGGEIPDFCKNLDNYLLGIKKDLVNSQAITIDTAFPKELQLISLSLSPEYLFKFPEIDKNSGQTSLEIIQNLVEPENQYGVAMLLPE